ncbi:MAG TPA: outer membrane lipoprotein carrier protein LolA [Azospirillum sp.]|nr:outer membrane lipoprotein carrier protein LolA [Azospirillum sp.]
MKIVIRQILAALAVLAALAAPALAAPRGVPLTAEDKAAVTQAEQYLNSIQTLQSKFLQVASNGKPVGGTFYLSRPGRMRLEYDPPIRDFVVADGRFLHYWDGEMEQPSTTSIGSTLADFILRPQIRLAGDVTVTEVYRTPGVVEITLIETKDPGKGALTLVFEDRPFQLRKWRVMDAQGLTTEVALLNPRQGVQLDPDLFIFREPARRRDLFR